MVQFISKETKDLQQKLYNEVAFDGCRYLLVVVQSSLVAHLLMILQSSLVAASTYMYLLMILQSSLIAACR